MEVSLAKCTVKKIVQADWSYLEGIPLKTAACGARGRKRGAYVMGEKKELMDFIRHQAHASQISDGINYRGPQRTPPYAPQDAYFTKSIYSQERTTAQVK